MRKLVVAEFLSLDGVMEAPKWTLPYWSEELAKFKHAELRAGDALLLGRKTYDNFAQAWPPRDGVDAYASRMNRLPKYVVSTTLPRADWNNSTVICAEIVPTIEQLKAQPGGNILVFGSGKLVTSLMDHNLIDEYRLVVYPIVLGSGQRLFPVGRTANLHQVASQSFNAGVMGLIYQPIDAPR